jgi:flavin reductase (DIM6/NTAB) family NADH-FMN oxidoreductase RutF
MGELDYPLLIVTTQSDGELSGCVVGFSTQSSIDPCRFLVCLSHENRTFKVASTASHLAVHLVSTEQRGIAEIFGAMTGDDVDKFSRCEWTSGAYGLPILNECPNFLIGRIDGRFVLGDHDGFLLEPESVTKANRINALCVRELTDMEPGHEP